MDKRLLSSQSLAASITKSASKQTYYTIRFLADRDLAADAYRAYAYFRWVDDVLDAEAGSAPEKMAFIHRQQSLLEACYRTEVPDDLLAEERMLADLVSNDAETNSGLQTYLRNMMGVMVFDAGRRGRVITQTELSEYTRMLATAVTEALFYFIGHDQPAPHHKARYLAVTAAHITHMLRDTYEDVPAGYYNISNEYLQAHGITPRDVSSQEYRKWVFRRVKLARRFFTEGREYMAQVKNLRCRLAGYAYTARFEWLLHAIESDGYSLRSAYPDRKSLGAALWMGRSILATIFTSLKKKAVLSGPAVQPMRIEER